MLSADELKSELINNLTPSESIDPAQVNNIYADTVASYIEDNCEVRGVYSGVFPNGNPDPSSGDKVIKIQNVNLTGEMLQAQFVVAIQAAIQGSIIKLTDIATTITLPAPISFSGFIFVFVPGSDFYINLTNIANTIVTGITSMVVMPASPISGCTSVSGGTGTFTIAGAF